LTRGPRPAKSAEERTPILLSDRVTTSMNRYVDERIAFSYPETLRCTWHPKSAEYYLRRGSVHIFMRLPDDEDWESLFDDAGSVWPVPRGSFDSEGQPIPTHDHWFTEYREHSFEGRANSMLSRTRDDKLCGKRVDLVLSRGEWRIWVRVDCDQDFSLDLVDPILASMTFPGEDQYVEAQRLGPIVQKQGSSPYVISLKYFPKSFRKGESKRAVKFDVEYQGGAVSDAQLRAVERLVAEPEGLYEQATVAVFRYYTEEIYPFMSAQIGPSDKLWPSCQTAEEVIRLVKLSGLMVHEPRDDGAIAIGLRFHCSWDEEHGLGLRIVGSTIEAVGPDFVALGSRGGEWSGFRAEASDPAN
jgi:hypothetical protein